MRSTLILLLLMSFVSITLTACQSATPPNGSTAPRADADALSARKLEILHFWFGGTEAPSFNALVEMYRREFPDVQVVNIFDEHLTFGQNISIFQSRLAREQPPDTWQLHAGKESIRQIVLGQLEPVTFLFKEEGFDTVMRRELLEQMAVKGELYMVPLNIHRTNVLWYNPKIFNENHLKPPATIDNFFTVAEALRAKGITPLAVGGATGIESPQLFETVLLATYGPGDFTRLMQGDAQFWVDLRLERAIATFKRMLDYSNADRSTMDFGTAALLVLDGKAGMTVMGDWLEPFYLEHGAKPNVDIAWSSAPGNRDIFMWNADSFGMAKGAPHREAVLAWLKVVGSQEAQDAFNPKKGSIPARVDADKSLYDAYLQWSIDQFRTDALAPSIVHGAAAPESFRDAFSFAVINFSSDRDENAFAEALRGAIVYLEQ